MIEYILRRLVYGTVTLFVVVTFVFFLVRVLPEGIIADESGASHPTLSPEARRQLGLDRPFIVQYGEWLYRIVRYGDFGRSYLSKRPVFEEVLERLPPTFQLAAGTMVVSVVLSITVGTLAAVRQDTWMDYLFRTASIFGQSIPDFWLGTLIMVVPAFTWGYLPPLGYVSPFTNLGDSLEQFIGPWLAMGVAFSATTLRMTRSQLLEVLRQDYVRTAWSKGLPEETVVLRHALRNALIPVMTLIGVNFGSLLGGTVTIEPVFVIPGLGLSTVNAVASRDYPQIQANLLVLATIFMLLNLLVDILYAWLDPRIRYA